MLEVVHKHIRLFRIAALGLVFLTVVLGVLWFLHPQDNYEPAIFVIGALAALVGVPTLTEVVGHHGEPTAKVATVKARSSRPARLASSSSRGTKPRPAPPHLSGRWLRMTCGVIIAIGALLAAYKRVGSDDLSQNVYLPLMQNVLATHNMIRAVSVDPPPALAFIQEAQRNGLLKRLPTHLRYRMEIFYDKVIRFHAAVQAVRELVIPEVSARIMEVRSVAVDQSWAEKTEESFRQAAAAARGAPDTAMVLAGINHEYRGRGFNSSMQAAVPGGPVMVVRDWVLFPETLAAIEALWTDLDYLYVNDRLESWQYRITRDDFGRNNTNLIRFLAPVHEVLRRDRDYEFLRASRPDLLEEASALQQVLESRVNDPKRLRDLLP